VINQEVKNPSKVGCLAKDMPGFLARETLKWRFFGRLTPRKLNRMKGSLVKAKGSQEGWIP
jgi:hypothetical protein